MGTVVQDRPQINLGSQPRWDRFEGLDHRIGHLASVSLQKNELHTHRKG